MKNRRLGGSGLEVSAIGLGCNPMSGDFGAAEDADSIATIHRALDLGMSFLDTAAMYGEGHNEELVGRALKGRRNDAVLATKFGIVILNPGSDPSEQRLSLDGSPEHVRAACEASLRRLDTDVIDLFYLHRVDPKVAIEDSVGAMATLVEEGKVRALGLSEASAEIIRRAHAVHPIAALQSEYSLWARDHESEILPVCHELGISFVAYSPLGRGFLAGAVRDNATLTAEDRRWKMPRFQGRNFEHNLSLLPALEAFAESKGCTLAQLALAWLLAQNDQLIPIPGTKRAKYAEQNAAAADVTLNADDLAQLNDAFPLHAAAGPRTGTRANAFSEGKD